MSHRGDEDDPPGDDGPESADSDSEREGDDVSTADTTTPDTKASDRDSTPDASSETGTAGLTDVFAGEERERLQMVPLTLGGTLVAITVASLIVRLAWLGARPFHFDEARVAYWSVHYVDTGSLAYRPIVHGPFIQLVNSWLFRLFGTSDFLARLTPAIVAGLLPASAYLFREHLRDTEVIALAGFLAFNAIFVYYSRYLRSDMLLVGFMFTGFGLLVRYYDTRRIRYLYGVGVFVALGLTTKENGLVYLLTWIGATGLLLDHALFPPRGFSTSIARIRDSWAGRLLGDAKTVALVPFKGMEIARERFDDPLAVRRTVAVLAVHTAGAALVGFLVLVFFYADRGAGMAGLQTPPTPASQGATGLYEAMGQPLQFPGYAYDTVAEAFQRAIDQWGSVGDDDRGFLEVYIEAFNEETTNILTYAPGLGAFAVFGFLYERYATERPRALVTFMSYCGIASLFGYSLQNDPGTGYWLTIHIILPLTVPAAVGVSRLYRWGRDALSDPDSDVDVVAFLVLFLVVSWGGIQTVETSYLDRTSEDNGLVQFAQPESEARDAFEAVSAISGSENPDVVLYLNGNYSGRYAYLGPPSNRYRKPTCTGTEWIGSLPMPWYLEGSGANTTCERNPTPLQTRITEQTPPIVVTKPGDATVPRQTLAEEGYVSRTFNFYRGAHPVTFHVHEEYVDQAPGWAEEGVSPTETAATGDEESG
jgi:uncharacterized protein (TIGR03663 family)